MARYSSTEQVGVHAVGHLFVSDLGWIFREQPISDMGIDAQVELVRGGDATGQLIGVQIKSGAGNFREHRDGLVYYGSITHLDYWLSHRLPVILVAHLPDKKATYWAHVQLATTRRTAKGWKILIPYRSNTLSVASRAALEAVFEGSMREQRLRRLALDEELMRLVKSGGRVAVEVQRQLSKGLARSPIQVIVEDDSGAERTVKEWLVAYTGHTVKGLVEWMFPWAKIRVDEDFYAENSEIEEDGHRSPEDQSFGSLRPYAVDQGEFASYRLRLSLNNLGAAYLRVSDHLGAPGN